MLELEEFRRLVFEERKLLSPDSRWTEYLNRQGRASSEYQISGNFDANDLERLGYPVAHYAQGRVGVTVTGEGRGFDVNQAQIELNLTQAAVEKFRLSPARRGIRNSPSPLSQVISHLTDPLVRESSRRKEFRTVAIKPNQQIRSRSKRTNRADPPDDLPSRLPSRTSMNFASSKDIRFTLSEQRDD